MLKSLPFSSQSLAPLAPGPTLFYAKSGYSPNFLFRLTLASRSHKGDRNVCPRKREKQGSYNPRQDAILKWFCFFNQEIVFWIWTWKNWDNLHNSSSVPFLKQSAELTIPSPFWLCYGQESSDAINNLACLYSIATVNNCRCWIFLGKCSLTSGRIGDSHNTANFWYWWAQAMNCGSHPHLGDQQLERSPVFPDSWTCIPTPASSQVS